MVGVFQAHYLQQRTTAEIKPKSNHDHHHSQSQPKSNRNKNLEAYQITNQITPTEIKVQNPQNNQSHKMKTLKVNPPLKKHMLVFLLYFRKRIILFN